MTNNFPNLPVIPGPPPAEPDLEATKQELRNAWLDATIIGDVAAQAEAKADFVEVVDAATALIIADEVVPADPADLIIPGGKT